MTYSNFQPMIEVTRGPIVESVHFGAAAVVDATGRLFAYYGDPYTITYLRSSAKPFQALPLIELGGAAAFHLTEEEIAITCASHSGTDRHVEVINAIQAKVGLVESNLACGTHDPIDEETTRRLIRTGEGLRNNRHNCSGKHMGMLAQAVLRHLPVEDYLNNQHPVQQADLDAFCDLCRISPESVHLGIDGCSAPVFGVPLYNGALGYARMADPWDVAEPRASACRTITHAMAAYSFMVGGPNRFDTDLMELAGDRLFCKGGAEGYHGIGIRPGVLGAGSPGLGITVKSSDGDHGGRSTELMALEVLRQLGVLTAAELEKMAPYDRRPVYNWRKLVVGEIRPCFTLQYPPK